MEKLAIKKVVLEPKDRLYILKNNSAPLAYYIASKDTPRKRLLFYNEATNTNHPLRYALNSNSPFQEEQDQNVIIGPIVFEDGVLNVPKTNPVLQLLLHYHPGNGTEFVEFDNEKDAEEDMAFMYSELDAQLAARDLAANDFNTLEAVARILVGGRVEKMSSSEIKRDMMLYAKRYPQDFLEAIHDPSLKINNIAARAFSDGYMTLKNHGKDIYFNLKENKKKLVTIPFGDNANSVLASYLQSNEGLELYKFLEEKISDNF
jgi:hypothetical protein